MDYKLEVINQIIDTDLGYFTEDEAKIDYAILQAQYSIANRSGYTLITIPSKYDTNIVDGAIWHLARKGTEGESANYEGAVQRTFLKIPDWLSTVIPKVGVVKLAGTK